MKQTIKVKGMHCKSCEMLIGDSLDELSGIKTFSVSEKNGTVEVDYDEDKVSLDKIKSVIKEEGYEVTN